MSFIAILGAGALGGALAHRLAARGRSPQITLIDSAGSIARGKALDILQSSPIEGFGTRVTAADRIEAAAGAAAIVIADGASGEDDPSGDKGLSLVRRVAAIDADVPLVFAGAAHRPVMSLAATELRLEPRRLIGSAPGALESAVRALVGLELDATGVEVQLNVVGIPPHAAVIAWEEASAFGQPVSSMVPPHRLAAISARVPGLWPPGPLALASAGARVAEAVACGSRRQFTCFVALDEPPYRLAVAAMPVKLGAGGVEQILRPALTRQERTRMENALS